MKTRFHPNILVQRGARTRSRPARGPAGATRPVHASAAAERAPGKIAAAAPEPPLGGHGRELLLILCSSAVFGGFCSLLLAVASFCCTRELLLYSQVTKLRRLRRLRSGRIEGACDLRCCSYGIILTVVVCNSVDVAFGREPPAAFGEPFAPSQGFLNSSPVFSIGAMRTSRSDAFVLIWVATSTFHLNGHLVVVV